MFCFMLLVFLGILGSLEDWFGRLVGGLVWGSGFWEWLGINLEEWFGEVVWGSRLGELLGISLGISLGEWFEGFGEFWGGWV